MCHSKNVMKMYRKDFLQRYFVRICLVTYLAVFVPSLCGGQETSGETPPATSSGSGLFSSVKKQGLVTLNQILSEELELDLINNVATFIGNVKVVRGETSVFSDRLVAYLDQTRKVEKAVVTGNVRLVYGDITATGDEGILYVNEQKLEINKNAKVWQENNTITAHQIVVFVEDEVIEGYGDKMTERAIMTIYSRGEFPLPSEQGSKAENPPESENADKEGAPPIVIISDKLRLDNSARRATFTGDVVATKDSSEIRSDKMIAYMSGTQETGNNLEKIEVFDNVRLTQETTIITGDKGVYNDKEKYAVVEGTERTPAQVEDKTKNIFLTAEIIEFFLETQQIHAKRRVKTKFETDESELQPGREKSTPVPKDQSKVNRDNLPSATLYPGRKK